MNVVPTSIALAQAGIESGYGNQDLQGKGTHISVNGALQQDAD